MREGIKFSKSIKENQKLIGTCFETLAGTGEWWHLYKIVGVDKEYVTCLTFDDIPGYRYKEYNNRLLVDSLDGSFNIINVPMEEFDFGYFDKDQIRIIPIDRFNRVAYLMLDKLLYMDFKKYKKSKWQKELEEEYVILQSGDEEKIKEYYDKKYANIKDFKDEELEIPEELKQKIEENKDLFKDSDCIF